jgi:preprotein translocase subunit SecE
VYFLVWSEESVAKKESKAGFFSKDNPILEYLKGTRSEVRKVNWPTRQEALRLTMVVLAVTISMALILGALDYVFAQFIGFIIRSV